METLDIQDINDGYYWLASRNVSSNQSNTRFSIFSQGEYGASINPLCYIYSGTADRESAGISYGLRPVFILKPEIKITGGNGTSGNPYTLGI